MSEVMPNVSCVAMRGRALLITGAPGSGKSSLALALLDRGGELIGDDGVTLSQVGELVVATPPPNTEGLIEIRNVGLLEVPTTRAPVAIVINLTTAAERLPLGHGMAILLGHQVPQVDLYPDTPALPLRAEAALEMHGLD
ncbi:HPr kinase/phosphatase C-terminal domain-containing protein [Aurantiacibacter sp. MUD11]|uniref:HPr kinase/phosphorylase n=1 Tax=Aurantiacibacter sp. MUD11 TaxID=3003265 RepID=UPI0022AB0126|nr:HPr kinase/phosphatase C-terminal domain-containing protein [Aurantiacibacter sp. MUD11]WAT18807.1 HPr kinase/phosphatase C-terminal domain-containing protein [Aurantiacibacter sp. MUD11]